MPAGLSSGNAALPSVIGMVGLTRIGTWASEGSAREAVAGGAAAKLLRRTFAARLALLASGRRIDRPGDNRRAYHGTPEEPTQHPTSARAAPQRPHYIVELTSIHNRPPPMHETDEEPAGRTDPAGVTMRFPRHHSD